MSKRIVFFGNERIATGTTTNNLVLRQLIEDDYDITAIVVNNEQVNGNHKVRKLEIADIAEEHGILLLSPDKPVDIANQLRDFRPEAAVLVAYGKIVPKSIIDIFPAGIINVHPSLLPKHRGPIPLESAILAGEQQTGLSLMSLAKEMDAGPVYAQTIVSLNGTETKQQLANDLLEIGAAMLHELLPGILEDNVVALPQDHQAATYDSRITKQDGIIDWSKPAKQLEREIRAYAGWPRSRTTLGGLEVIVTQSHAVPSQTTDAAPGGLDIVSDIGHLGVITARGTLWIDRLQPVGKKEMTAAEFIRGYGQRLMNT